MGTFFCFGKSSALVLSLFAASEIQTKKLTNQTIQDCFQSTHNGEPCKSNGGGRCEKAREAKAGCCKGGGQWKSCKEGGQEKCQEGKENARQDDQKQEDCGRVLKPQTKSFKEYNRKSG